MTNKAGASPAQMRALRRAAHRSSGCICPLPDVHGDAEMQLIAALIRKGWATYGDRGPHVPLITAAGRALAAGSDS